MDDGLDAPARLRPKVLFSETALRGVGRGPRFREVAEASAAEAIAEFQRLDPASRWLMKDLGRTSIYMAAYVLSALPGGLTLSGLIAPLVANRVANRGRIVAFVERALATGRLEVAPGPLPWTQRPLILRSAFVEVLRDRAVGALTIIGRVDPTCALAATRLSDDRALEVAYFKTAEITALVQTWGAPHLPRIEFFMTRDGGLKILQGLLLRQPSSRARLLEASTFSKTDLAKRCAVSRIHLDTLLEDAESEGLLVRAGRGAVMFDPALSDSYELWIAMQIQAARLVAEAVLAHET
jgi:hypothetical protein